MSQLFAASLASVCRSDLHAILQPFIRDLVIVDIDLKSNCLLLLSMKVLEACCDDDGWNTTKAMMPLPNNITGTHKATLLLFLCLSTNWKYRMRTFFTFLNERTALKAP